MTSIIFKGILEPKGGPSGYLYNLKESLELNSIENIRIICMENNQQKKESLFKKIKSILKNKIKLPCFIQEKRKISFYKNLLIDNLEVIQKSKILHFHTTQDLYYFSKIYDLSKHTVLLMSHAPEPPNIEVYNSFLSQGYNETESKARQQIQKEADVFAFNKANYLIFPCIGAVSPYNIFFEENQIDKIKLRYVITSSKPLIANTTKEDFLNKFNIPKGKKIISYVGRKNMIKGFDIFCEIAKKLKDNEKFYFISAGTGDIKAPKQDNFLDIGWTDDPASLVNAADIQVVPNRDTYFDLGIIQALSINTTLLTTNTGGNSWFKNKNLNIYFANCNDINSFINILIDENNYTKNYKNIDFYKNTLSNNIFAINYKNLYESL